MKIGLCRLISLASFGFIGLFLTGLLLSFWQFAQLAAKT
jgi:hypothetical protein